MVRAIAVITSYATKLELPISRVLVRLDGLYGNSALLTDVLSAGLGMIARCKDYALLDQQGVRHRLTHPPDQVTTHAESGVTRALLDCRKVPLTATGPCVRLVATQPARSSPLPVGVERDGVVYELFVSTLPSPDVTPSGVLDLYLHRGSFETVLADED
jgi:hypothetical protein